MNAASDLLELVDKFDFEEFFAFAKINKSKLESIKNVDQVHLVYGDPMVKKFFMAQLAI
jgi:general stress protein 26